MKKLFMRLAVGAAFVAAAVSAQAGETLDRVMEKKAMVVATNSGWPPQSYLDDNNDYERWSTGRDGASSIARLLFEEATDINFFVGCAVNPAHQNPELPINFNLKMRLVEQLSDCLMKMGKRIKTSYF